MKTVDSLLDPSPIIALPCQSVTTLVEFYPNFWVCKSFYMDFYEAEASKSWSNFTLQGRNC